MANPYSQQGFNFPDADSHALEQQLQRTSQYEIAQDEKDIMYCLGFIELMKTANDERRKAELDHMDRMVMFYSRHNQNRLNIERAIKKYGEDFKRNLDIVSTTGTREDGLIYLDKALRSCHNIANQMGMLK